MGDMQFNEEAAKSVETKAVAPIYDVSLVTVRKNGTVIAEFFNYSQLSYIDVLEMEAFLLPLIPRLLDIGMAKGMAKGMTTEDVERIKKLA